MNKFLCECTYVLKSTHTLQDLFLCKHSRNLIFKCWINFFPTHTVLFHNNFMFAPEIFYMCVSIYIYYIQNYCIVVPSPFYTVLRFSYAFMMGFFKVILNCNTYKILTKYFVPLVGYWLKIMIGDTLCRS